jgi:hypothetical protein
MPPIAEHKVRVPSGILVREHLPVTAKLSRRFYERLGDDVANELVDWFNQVDLTYRTDLRDLNDANFARFDAKLEQRLAILETRLIRWMFLCWAGALGTLVALQKL